VLEDDLDLTQALQETNVDSIYVLTSGEKPKKSTLLLSSERMKKLVSTLSGQFDFVLLDSPALLEVGDTEVISDCADAFILVVRREEASREGTVSASSYVNNIPDKVSLLVINQGMESDGYYYHPNGFSKKNIISDIKTKLSYRKNAAATKYPEMSAEIDTINNQKSLLHNKKKPKVTQKPIRSAIRNIKNKIQSWFRNRNKPEATEDQIGLHKRNLKKNSKIRSYKIEKTNLTNNSSRLAKRNLINNLNSKLRNR